MGIMNYLTRVIVENRNRDDEEMWIPIDESKASFDRKECKGISQDTTNFFIILKVSGYGTEYRGTMSVTKTGKLCKDWRRMQTWSASYPLSCLDGAYCRQVDFNSAVDLALPKKEETLAKMTEKYN